MITQILFEIPEIYGAAVKAGSLLRVGGLLKDAATGQIVAHLQESGLAHSVLSTALGASTGPFGVAGSILDMATGAYTTAKLGKIEGDLGVIKGQLSAMQSMMASLQTLQYATLGVSLIGIGVSVAGFIYMHKRFNALDSKFDYLIKSVQSEFLRIREAALRTQMSKVNGLIKAAKQAPTLSRPDLEFSRIAEQLSEQAAHFEGEIEFLIKTEDKMQSSVFWQLVQILALTNSVRIDCRIRTNELRNAREIAESVSQDYRRLFDPISVSSFHGQMNVNSVLVKTIRDMTDAATTKPYLIEHLRTHRINGSDYLDRLDKETEQPLLMLRVK